MVLYPGLDHRQVDRILDVENVFRINGRVHRIVERLRDGQRHDGLERLGDSLTLRVAADRVPLFRTRHVEGGADLFDGDRSPVLNIGRVAVQGFQVPGAEVFFFVVIPVDVDGKEGRLLRALVGLNLVHSALPPAVVDLENNIYF